MYTLTVTPDEITILGEALDEMPFKRVHALVDKLRGQIAEQNAPAPVVPPANMGVVDTRTDVEVPVELAAEDKAA